MKVGDYVRTNKGIEKITFLDGYTTFKGYKKHMSTDRGEYEDLVDFANIIKSSPNIIDLIEVGDYVNGYLVIEKGDTYFFVGDDLGIKHYLLEDIKSIVTKEQFESMEYKVEEK